jgi:carbamoyltransferase
MIVMGVNLSHDGSVCVIDSGEVVFYQEEERVTHEKHTTGVINSFVAGMKHNPTHVIFTGALPYELDANMLFTSLMAASGKIKHFENYAMPEVSFMRDHHLTHASAAFYNSGFEEAAVVIIDGAGQSFIDDDFLYRESETLYHASYNKFNVISKRVFKQHSRTAYNAISKELLYKPYLTMCDKELPTKYPVKINNSGISIGKMFSKVGINIFNGYHQAGKVMGLSAYGSDNPDHPKAFVNGIPNEDIFTAGLSNEDLAYRVQKDSLMPVVDLIREAIDGSGSENVCLSGGYFLNCVNNYKYLKLFPGINFYVEPNSSDAGTALGAAKYLWHMTKGDYKVREVESLYMSSPADYRYDSRDIRDVVQTGPTEIAEIIANRNVVAIYQGQAEAGPRALGNRSILYDPRDPDGRDVVNKIKKREYFRPFAGSVLEDRASEWFDMATLKSSPYMMYAVQALDERRNLIPGLQHNDGTSRIQTVNESQNKNYHNLIKEFDKITGVPMLLNTSFNLAGDTLVQTMDDAIRTCREGGIEFLYCPEINTLILI